MQSESDFDLTNSSLNLDLDPERLFFSSINSPETKKAYRKYLKGFMQFMNCKTINSLITDFDNNGQSSTKDNSNRSKDIERRVVAFVVHLKEDNGMNYYAVKNYLTPVMSFYKINDVMLNTKKINKFMPPKVKRKKDRGYTDEELLKLVNIADERMKVVIYILRSSGCRIGAIRDLRVRNLERIGNSGNGSDLYRITIYENDSEEYTSFVTPEGSQAIDSYLDMRKKYGEKITPDSHLIREQFDIRDDFSITIPKQIATSTLQGILIRLAERANVRQSVHLKEGQKSGTFRKEVPITHGFRKSFSTTANNTGMDIIKRRMLQGHDIGIDEHYTKPTESDLLKEYQKSIDALTIDPSNRLQRKLELREKEISEIDKLKLMMADIVKELKMEKDFMNSKLVGYEEVIQMRKEKFENMAKAEQRRFRKETIAEFDLG